jgi:predicted phosphoribosyltransferase
MHQRLFVDRREAGRILVDALLPFKAAHPLVLALPRGGVPVGYEIAYGLGPPLEVFIVRKIGVPGHRELAMGALASGGIRVLDADLIGHLGVPAHLVDAVIAEETQELTRREERYGAGRAEADDERHISDTTGSYRSTTSCPFISRQPSSIVRLQ